MSKINRIKIDTNIECQLYRARHSWVLNVFLNNSSQLYPRETTIEFEKRQTLSPKIDSIDSRIMKDTKAFLPQAQITLAGFGKTFRNFGPQCSSTSYFIWPF